MEPQGGFEFDESPAPGRLRVPMLYIHDLGQAPAVNKWERLVTKILEEPWPGARALALQLSRFGLSRHDVVSATADRATADSIQALLEDDGYVHRRCLAHASWRIAESS